MTDSNADGPDGQTFADVVREIHDLFRDHPQCRITDDDQPLLPGDALVDIMREITQRRGAEFVREVEDALVEFTGDSPRLFTPEDLLLFMARHAAGAQVEQAEAEEQARMSEPTEYEFYNRSRSGSPETIGASVYRPPSRPSSRPPSRPPSRGPPVPPKTPLRDSPFDNTRRQRTTPLPNAAPSSWTRRPPPQRRRSDAGMQGRDMSDSDVSQSAYMK